MKSLPILMAACFFTFISAFLISMPYSKAETGSQTYRADRDTYMDTMALSTPHGTLEYLWLSEFETTRAEYQQVFVHFAVNNIPAGATITSATLSFFMIQCHNQPTNNVFFTANAQNDWDENVIWNQHPMQGDTRLSSPVLACSSDTWVDYPVKIIVQNWVNSTYPNYGFVLYSALSTPWDRQFQSRESGEYGTPKLSVSYTYTPGSTPTVSTSGNNSGSNSTISNPKKTATKSSAKATVTVSPTATDIQSEVEAVQSEDQANKNTGFHLFQYMKSHLILTLLVLFFGLPLIAAIPIIIVVLVKKRKQKQKTLS